MYIACVGRVMVKSLQTDSFLLQTLFAAGWFGSLSTCTSRHLNSCLGGSVRNWRQMKPSPAEPAPRGTRRPVPGDFTAQGFLGWAAILCPPSSDLRALTGRQLLPARLREELCWAQSSLSAPARWAVPRLCAQPFDSLSACVAFAVLLKDKNKLISLQTSFTAEQHRLSHWLVYCPFLSPHHPHPLPALWTSDFPAVGNLNYCLLSYRDNLLCTLTKYFILIYVNFKLITF